MTTFRLRRAVYHPPVTECEPFSPKFRRGVGGTTIAKRDQNEFLVVAARLRGAARDGVKIAVTVTTVAGSDDRFG